VDGTHGSAVAGLRRCLVQPREQTPKPVWNPDIPQPIDFFEGWQEVPTPATTTLQGAVGAVSQARRRRRRLPLGLLQGAKGVQLAELAEELAAEEVVGRTGAEIMKRDTMLTIKLPAAGGTLEDYAVREPKSFRRPSKAFTRRALAAAHVVADPLSSKAPWLEPAIDWDATIAYRKHLWSWGWGLPKRWTPRSAAWGSTGDFPRIDRQNARCCEGRAGGIRRFRGRNRSFKDKASVFEVISATRRNAAPSRSSVAASFS